MRVLQIQGLAGQGGAEVHTYQLSRGLLERGHDVVIAAPNTDSRPINDAEAAGCKIFRFREVASWARLFDFRAGSEMVQLVKKEKIDVVQSHLWNAHVLAIMARFSTQVPAVATLHGPYITSTTNRRAIHHVHRAVYRRLMQRMDRIIAISEFVKQLGMNDLRLRSDQIDVVHNCSDVSLFDKPQDRAGIRANLGIKESDVVFGLVGSITQRKGPFEFIRAGINVSKSGGSGKFMLVGEGPLRADCEQMIHNSGLADHFIFTGYRTDIAALLAAMDALVVTSVEEGFGLTITEAMSSSLPVIAYDSGAPAEIILDEMTGFLVPNLDLETLTKRIQTLMNDSASRLRMGKAGLARARADFDIPVFVSRTEKILLEAAGHISSDH